MLSRADSEYLYRKFMNLNAALDPLRLKYEVRLLLISIFTKFFMNTSFGEENPPPAWLEEFFDRIKKPEIYTGEKIDFSEISGKSREHTLREFKKYYGTTPVDYVNSLKLNFAQNLLLTSNMSVLDVALESGFSNLHMPRNLNRP